MSMFLHFEDWSAFMWKLDENNIPHGDHILKVYASDEDPRQELGFNRDSVAVFEVDDTPFRADEAFDYGERGEYTGSALEAQIQEMNLPDLAARRLRALFRFANQDNTGFTQEGMKLRNSEGGWLIDHPFGDIDGLEKAALRPDVLHLDVFVDKSLKKVAELLKTENLSEAGGIVSYDERVDLMRRQRGK